jgi:uncharacterized cupin superfamily protein
MYEIAEGVFRSSLTTNAYEPDEEVGGGVVQHVFRDDATVQAGLYRAPSGPGDPEFFVFEHEEAFLVLEGSVEIEIEDGPIFELHSGDMASIRKGVRCAWRERPGFKKFWVSV